MKYLILLLTLTMSFGQTELTTRVYELNQDFDAGIEYDIDLLEITGYELDFAFLKIAKITDSYIDDTDTNCRLYYYPTSPEGDWNGITWDIYDSGAVSYSKLSLTYDSSYQLKLKFDDASGSVNLLLSVTAEFPQEDTGLQGDMNDDEILDILDVVLMVNIILDGDQSFNMLDTIDSFSRI